MPLFVDIRKDSKKRINLFKNNKISLKISWFLKFFSVVVITASFLGFTETPTNNFSNHASAQEEVSSPEENQQKRAELESQLAELESQIEEHQKTIESYQKEGKTLSGEISALNTKIAKLNLQIKSVNLNLEKLNQNITETQKQINRTENKIVDHKSAISDALRSLYEADNQSLVEVLLANSRLSNFFNNLANITLAQNNLRVSLNEIVKLRQDLLSEKEELSLQKEDAENLKAIQQAQKKSVEVTQTEKSNVLKITKGKEAEYQKLLTKTKESAAQIRSRIFELLGGGELTFEKAYDYARLAESATGVRAALTLAILHRESLLGKNLGRCSYQTAMHPTRDIPYFLDLLSRLGINPDSEIAKVSCPISSHGSYGGAMGPSQFIPSTWKLYEKKISAVTNNVPPSPWNNSDAFAATAVYMKDLLESSSCKTYANENKNTIAYQTLLERCAAAKYYSGSRWYTYRFWYGDPVVTKANEFEKDISVLQGNG